MGVREKAREIAVQALYQLSLRGLDDLEEVAAFRWVDEDAYVGITGQAGTWFRGTVAAVVKIDQLVDQHLENWTPDRVGRMERAILRLGTYELMAGSDTSVEVVINECVNLAKRYCDADSFKFVNGVLDAVAGSLGRKTFV
jgi:N utilization substance protein B